MRAYVDRGERHGSPGVALLVVICLAAIAALIIGSNGGFGTTTGARDADGSTRPQQLRRDDTPSELYVVRDADVYPADYPADAPRIAASLMTATSHTPELDGEAVPATSWSFIFSRDAGTLDSVISALEADGFALSRRDSDADDSGEDSGDGATEHQETYASDEYVILLRWSDTYLTGQFDAQVASRTR